MKKIKRDLKNKTLLFSLSKEKGDFVIQPFIGSGKGGQKRNKKMTACRIIHPASGAVSECQEERSFRQNRKRAFERLCEKPKFTAWLKKEISIRVGEMDKIKEKVEKTMKEPNLLVEVKEGGKWVKLREEDL